MSNLRNRSFVTAMFVFSGAALSISNAALAQDGGEGTDPYASLPGQLVLTGVVRDFKERSVAGGHTDFELNPSGGFGHFAYIVADQLDSEGKPVFNSAGRKVTANWKDSKGNIVMPPRAHLPMPAGGTAGSVSSSLGGQVISSESFSQWFRDVPGVNMSAPLAITLVRQANSNVYTFNDKTDPLYSTKGGFFPINGQMYGNSLNNDKNFHFTYELDTEFTYKAGTGQVFKFVGDDDVFVFIDGKCVVDIGGIHGAVTQTVNLDNMAGLQDGHKYNLKFFFAERHRTQSNFKIETTLELQNVELPAVDGTYDEE